MELLNALLLFMAFIAAALIVLFLYLRRQHQDTKERLSKVRIDIRQTVERLKTRHLTGDEYSVDDSIDFLVGINATYSDEVPFLLDELEKAEEEETLNFIILALEAIGNALTSQVISILESKIYLVSNKFLQGNTVYNTYDTIRHIFGYFINQGKPYKETINSVLTNLISSPVYYSIKSDAQVTLKKTSKWP